MTKTRGVTKGTKRGPYKIRKKQNLEDISVHEDGMSYHEIAKIMGLTVKQVKDIETSALKKLRAPTEKNKVLREYSKISDIPEPGELKGE